MCTENEEKNYQATVDFVEGNINSTEYLQLMKKNNPHDNNAILDIIKSDSLTLYSKVRDTIHDLISS